MPSQDATTLQPVHHHRYAGHLLGLAVAFSLACFLFFEPWDGGGGPKQIWRYARIPSLVLSGDLDVSDDFLMALNGPERAGWAAVRLTREGYTADYFPVGSSLLTAPFWLAANAVRAAVEGTSAGEGYAPIHRFWTSFAAVFYGFIGLLLTWRAGCRFVSSRLALVSAAATFFGSMAVIYCFKRPGFPHACSLFAAALFLYAAVEYAPYRKWSHAVFVGSAGGLMVLADWRSFPFLLLAPLLALDPAGARPWDAGCPDNGPDPDRAAEGSEEAQATPTNGPETENKRSRRTFAGGFAAVAIILRVATALAAFALALAPQGFVWRKVFGSWIALPWTQDFPFGPARPLGWSFGQWVEALLGGVNGLYHWHPLTVLSTAGLILLALRRNALGVSLFLATAAVTLLSGFSFRSPLEPEEIGAGQFCLLAPFLAVGTAACFQELRSRSARHLLAACLGLAVVWNLIVMVAANRGLVRFSPLAGSWAAWSALLPQISRHPFAFFGDSLLLRFLVQGPAPLEELASLLLMVALFPAMAWIGLRGVLPVARKWLMVGLLALAVIGVLVAFDVVVWRSELPVSRESGNRRLREILLRRAPDGTLASGGEQDLIRDLDDFLPRYPTNLPAAYLRARLAVRQGDRDQARRWYEVLASRSSPAGEIGLLETARTPEEELRAAESLARRAGIVGGEDVVGAVMRAFQNAGQPGRARDWVDRAFLPSGAHWLMRAELAAHQPDLYRDCLEKALLYAPTDPRAVERMWRDLRDRSLFARARAVADRFEPVAQERIRLYRALAERPSPGTLGPFAAGVRPYAETLERIYAGTGQETLAARAREDAAFLSSEARNADGTGDGGQER